MSADEHKVAVAITDDSYPEPCARPSGGAAQVIAWHRVCDMMRDFGAVRDDEIITHFVATDRGIEVFTEKRKPRPPEYLSVAKRGSRK